MRAWAAALSMILGLGAWDAHARPGTPTNNEVVRVTPNYVGLNWRTTHDVDDHVTYEIEATKNGAPVGVNQPEGTSGAGSAGDAWRGRGGASIYDLEPMQHYCFRVWTRNVDDQMRSALPSNWACTDTPPHPPLAPHDVEVIYRPGQSAALLSWRLPDQSGYRPATRFEIDRQSPPGEGRPTFLDGAVDGPDGAQNVSTRVDYGYESTQIALPGDHVFRVCTVNNGGRTCGAWVRPVERPFETVRRPDGANIADALPPRPNPAQSNPPPIARWRPGAQAGAAQGPSLSESASPNVWMNGRFDTDFGLLVLNEAGGVYDYNGGVVLVHSIDGAVMEGEWSQTSGGRRCADGRYNGRFRFTFTPTGFTGQYGFCGDPPTAGAWNGTRR